MNDLDFTTCFKKITSHPPFGWQERLYVRLLNGDIPPLCDIPTGLGKTSVLALWLLALADQAATPGGAVTLPRRLVYIVDRRAVVDQATDDAEALLRRLQKVPQLAPVASALRGLAAIPAADGKPFALSTLRGQFADNREWSRDPVRPAIIVGTVDMIGSRLLFSGYGGLGRYGRSQHAGLLGQDALIVLDEAQLAPAFTETLRAIERAVCAGSGALKRPFAFMSLTATPPRAAAPGLPLTLESADFEQETVCRRVRAAKALRFVPPEPGGTGKPDDALAQRMAREAARLAGENGAVVVFVDTVTQLDRIHDALGKLPGLDPERQILRFTGQMRGYERDQAFANHAKTPEGGIFQEFQRPRPRAGQVSRDYPVFLLATSAGEVGVNFDADHAVCDLVSLERTAQRLGRVNRGGDHDGPAQISVFLDQNPEKLEGVRAVTHQLLRELPDYAGPQSETLAGSFSASPEDLGRILKKPEAQDAYTPAGDPPPLDPARLDDWSLTSLSQDEFPRPQVSYWLRGITPDEAQAVTQLVWREEMRYARNAEDAADLAKTCPPLPREILQVPTYRAVNWLLARVRKHLGVRRLEADPHHGELAAIRTPAGQWESRTLDYFQDKDNFKDDLVGATLVLPTSLGGLDDHGYLDESAENRVKDVLEEGSGPAEPADGHADRRALLYGSPTAGWQDYDLLAGPPPAPSGGESDYAEMVRSLAKAFQAADPSQRYRLKSRANEPEKSASPGDEEAGFPFFRVEYFVPARSYKAGGAVPLDEHLNEARRCAEDIVTRLHLPSGIREAVVLAAAWHDLGKNREKWQRAIGNRPPVVALAKSNNSYYDNREAEGYRHEFGSLMDALHLKQTELLDHPERDLVLHLIAAHHGHGRPGFAAKAYDVPEHLFSECRAAAEEAELRFDKLQRRFGWWGLAYLEALVKCADGLASDHAANPPSGSISQP